MMVMIYRMLRVLVYLTCGVTVSIGGLVTVVPEQPYVENGTNFTAFCSVNTTKGSSADLIWYRGYPPFLGLGPSGPPKLPSNVQKIINESTVSITFFDMHQDMDDYYHCFLRNETLYDNAAVCHITVIESPSPVEDLKCGANNRYSFYCYWKDTDSRHHETYNATYQNRIYPQETLVMDECSHDQITPGWTNNGSYQRRCVDSLTMATINVFVRHTNYLGSADAKTTFSIYSDVKPLPLDSLKVLETTARSFHITGGPPPLWEAPGFSKDRVYLSEYEIQYSSDDGDTWTSVKVNTEDISLTIDGLTPNTLYKIRARTKYLITWSDWSKDMVERTQEAAPSGTVQHLRVEEHPSGNDKTVRSLNLEWQDLDSSDKGSDTFVYYVEIVDQGSLQVVHGGSTVGTTMFFGHISKFHAYTIRVIPGNRIGNGTATEASILDQSNTLGKPAGLKWKMFNKTAGTLSWKDPEDPNAIITKFIVKWRRLSEHEHEIEEVTWEEGTHSYSLPLTGLTEKEHYHFSVCAVSLSSNTCGEIASIEGYTGGGLAVPIAYIIVPIAVLVLLFILICLVQYHRKVKRNLPEPYFVDAVKVNIYGQSSWNYEDQLFIQEKESFDTLRTADDSTTQLLGLDRMCSTEGSTSSSDQGIHDMDGHLTTSCTRLVPAGAEKDQAPKGNLRVVCENFDKDCNDAVFPEEPCGESVRGASGVASTPPNTPASCHSTEEEDKLGAVGGAPPDYAKFVDPKQLSPCGVSPGSTATTVAESRPLSSASEDSMNYMRVGEGELATPVPKPLSQNLPEMTALNEADSAPKVEPAVTGGTDQTVAPQPRESGRPDSPKKNTSEEGGAPRRHPSSSDEDFSGYCKQDVILGGSVPAVTSSGVSSMGEDYSRIADAGNSGAHAPREMAPSVVQPMTSPPAVDDPYVTVETLSQGPPQPSPAPVPAASPITSPYVTADQAV